MSRIKKLIRLIINSPRTIRDIIFCHYHLNTWDSSWTLRGLPLIQKHPNAKIIIGKNLILCSDPRRNTIGVFQKVILKALKQDSIIKLGDNVGISGATISGEHISIGNNVLVGSGALISDSDAHPIHPDLRNRSKYVKSSPIIIEDDVFIGARVIILKGVTIGKGSVIGAGAVVVTDIPAMSIAAGNPAKVLSEIRDLQHYTNED